jgi:hypothetical protein
MNNPIINHLILKYVLKDDSSDNIKKLFAGIFEQDQIDYISKVIYDKDYEFLKKGDYIKIKLEDSGLESVCNLDQLIDLGLFSDGYVYGQVINSDDYKLNFNPYYPRMKITLFSHSDDLKIKLLETEKSTILLTKINKAEIKYFKYVKNITTTS